MRAIDVLFVVIVLIIVGMFLSGYSLYNNGQPVWSTVRVALVDANPTSTTVARVPTPEPAPVVPTPTHTPTTIQPVVFQRPPARLATLVSALTQTGPWQVSPVNRTTDRIHLVRTTDGAWTELTLSHPYSVEMFSQVHNGTSIRFTQVEANVYTRGNPEALLEPADFLEIRAWN